MERENLDDVLRAAQPAVDVREGHREELRARLLDRFDQLHPRKGNTMRIARNVAFVSAAVLGLGILACQAPTEADVVVGKKIEIAAAPGTALPAVPEIVALLEKGAGSELQIQARHMRTETEERLEIEAWGDGLTEAPIAATLRAALPSLAGTTIQEHALEAKARVTLGDKLGHELFDSKLDGAALEAARQRLIDQIRAVEGKDAHVDVQTDMDPDGHHRVKVEVRKEAHAQ